MAKNRGRLDFKNEADEVVSRCRKEDKAWKKERLQTVRLLLETDKSYEEIAGIMGRHLSRIKEWAKQFQIGGINQLLLRGHGGGRKPLISSEAAEELTEKLRVGAFRTADQASEWLKKEHGLEYGKGSIYYVLGNLGGRLKVPRPSQPPVQVGLCFRCH